MIRTIKRTFLILALLLAAYAGFRWGPAVFPRLERALGVEESGVAPRAEPEPSPELADGTLDRFERFRQGDSGNRLALSGTELTSVVRYSLPGILPPGVEDTRVELEGERVKVTARVATRAFPQLPDLDAIIGLLPDTIPIEVRGTLVPHDQTHLALIVDRIRASHVPIPTRLLGDVLAGLGREPLAGLPEDALGVPLPDGLESVRVQNDSLILVAEPPPGN